MDIILVFILSLACEYNRLTSGACWVSFLQLCTMPSTREAQKNPFSSCLCTRYSARLSQTNSIMWRYSGLYSLAQLFLSVFHILIDNLKYNFLEHSCGTNFHLPQLRCSLGTKTESDFEKRTENRRNCIKIRCRGTCLVFVCLFVCLFVLDAADVPSLKRLYLPFWAIYCNLLAHVGCSFLCLFFSATSNDWRLEGRKRHFERSQWKPRQQVRFPLLATEHLAHAFYLVKKPNRRPLHSVAQPANSLHVTSSHEGAQWVMGKFNDARGVVGRCKKRETRARQLPRPLFL